MARLLLLPAFLTLACAGSPPRAEDPVVAVVAEPPAPLQPAVAAAPADNPPAPAPTSAPRPAASASPISAADKAAARSLFQEAVKAYTEGRYGAARQLFGRAYSTAPMPQVLYNMAMADLMDGDRQDACAHFEQWKAAAQPPPDRLQQAEKAFAACSGASP